MIRLILGGIGSGKSASAVKDIIDRNEKTFSNFDIKKQPKLHRLMVEDIIKTEVTRVKKSGEEVKRISINWDFWNKLIDDGVGFDVCLDEIHNILHSRRSMSRWNTLVGTWLSQIRKILGDSENNHLTAISQRLEGVDVILRDLLFEIVHCRKWQSKILMPTRVIKYGRYEIRKLPITYIIKTVFQGEGCIDRYNSFRMGSKSYTARFMFLANPYYQFYESFKLVRFGESAYL